MMGNEDIKSLLKRQDDDALKLILERLWSQEKGRAEIESWEADDSPEVHVDWDRLQELALTSTPRERLHYWITRSRNWLPIGVTIGTSIAASGLYWFVAGNLYRLAPIEQILLGVVILGLGSITFLMLLVCLAVLSTHITAKLKARKRGQSPGEGLNLGKLLPTSFAALTALVATCIVALGLVQIGSPTKIGSADDVRAWSSTIDGFVSEYIVTGKLDSIETPNGVHYFATKGSRQIVLQMQDNPKLLEYVTANRGWHDADSLLVRGIVLEMIMGKGSEALPVYVAALKSSSGSAESRWAAWSNASRFLTSDQIADLSKSLAKISDDHRPADRAVIYQAFLDKLDHIVQQEYSAD